MMNTNTTKLLITGVSGLLGSNLAHYFRTKYEVLGLYNTHPVTIPGADAVQCDLRDASQAASIIGEFGPAVVIHCASATRIDQCESDRTETERMNVSATRHLRNGLAGTDTALVYISTDAVYDGVAGLFSEQDAVGPQNYYGQTKYEGEQEALKHANTLVLRTNIFGWNVQNKMSLGEWIVDELSAGRTIQGFHDAFFSSVYTMELARAIDIAVRQGLRGVYNCASSDSCSKYEFARKLAAAFGLEKALVRPVSLDDARFTAKRGKNLSLQVAKFQKDLDYRLPSIDESIGAFYRDQRSGVPAELKEATAAASADRPLIPYGQQWISNSDIRAVVGVLMSDRLTQGPAIEAFEESLTAYCGARHAVAMNSATSALHASCLAAGVGQGDEVITSPITFVASANCAVYCGARPVFADIDPLTYNVDPREIERNITSRTRAVIPVHFAGQSCDMASIREVVTAAERRHGRKIHIIEDASHALGSRYQGHTVGSGAYSDMTVLSFHPVKHITTGEGGAALTNDGTLAKMLRRYRSHGITSAPDEFENRDLAFPQPVQDDQVPNPWYYEQIALGYNYRITDIQSALGRSQLRKLDQFRQRRRQIVQRYNEAFQGIKAVSTPFEHGDCDSNFHLYVLLFDFAALRMDRATFMTRLKSRGVQTQVHYIPIHLQPFYRRRFGTKQGDFPHAEAYYAKCLSIPLYPAMNDRSVDKVVRVTAEQVQRGSEQ